MTVPFSKMCLLCSFYSVGYGKPFVPPVKGNIIGNGEVNRNGKQLTNGKRNDCFNVKQESNAHITKSLKYGLFIYTEINVIIRL